MPLLDAAGRRIDDPWVNLADDEPVAGPHVILSLERLLEKRDEVASHPGAIGVRLGPDAKVQELAGLVGRLSLVVVAFPQFRDGRGFTIARTLRERQAFAGDIRATGHLLPDQYHALMHCGFSSIEVCDGQSVERWAQAAARLPANPDAGPEGAPALPLLRRIALPLGGVRHDRSHNRF